MVGCHLYCRLFSSNGDLQSLEANSISPPPGMTTKLVSGYCPMCFGGLNHPAVENHCPRPSLEVWIWTSVCVLSHFSRVWLCDPMDCSLPGSSVRGTGWHALLQGMLLTHLLCLLHWRAGSFLFFWRAGSLPLVPPGKLLGIWIVLSKCLWKKRRSLAYVLLNLNSSGTYD